MAALLEHETAVDAVALLITARKHYARASIGTVYRFMRELERHELVEASNTLHGRIHWKLRDGDNSPPAIQASDSQPGDNEALTVLRQIAERLGYRLIRRDAGFIY